MGPPVLPGSAHAGPGSLTVPAAIREMLHTPLEPDRIPALPYRQPRFSLRKAQLGSDMAPQLLSPAPWCLFPSLVLSFCEGRHLRPLFPRGSVWDTHLCTWSLHFSNSSMHQHSQGACQLLCQPTGQLNEPWWRCSTDTLLCLSPTWSCLFVWPRTLTCVSSAPMYRWGQDPYIPLANSPR